MNINDDRFGNIRKEGRKNLGSGRKYTALRLFIHWKMGVVKRVTVKSGPGQSYG